MNEHDYTVQRDNDNHCSPHHQHQHTLAVVLECSPPISLLDSHLHDKSTSEFNLLRESCVLPDSNGSLKTGVAVRIRRPQKNILDSSCWSILSLHRILPTSLMPHGFWDDRHRMILILAPRLSSSEKLREYGAKQTGNKQMVQRTIELEILGDYLCCLSFREMCKTVQMPLFVIK